MKPYHIFVIVFLFLSACIAPTPADPTLMPLTNTQTPTSSPGASPTATATMVPTNTQTATLTPTFTPEPTSFDKMMDALVLS
jgi:hypothetical protein